MSVSSNFDDKLNFSKGEINSEKSFKTLEYYKRVEEYLSETENYKWIVNNDRKVTRVLAVINTPANISKFEDFLSENKITLLRFEEMISGILDFLENNKGMKIQNQTLRILQILKEKEILRSR